MKRKLVQHGKSTLIVSLPSKWVRKNKLKKGEEVTLNDKGNLLEIFTSSTSSSSSLDYLEYDISGLDRSSVIYLIYAAYKRGYNKVKITFENDTFLYNRTKKVLPIYEELEKIINKRLIGFVVTSHDKNHITFEEISNSKKEDLSSILNRIIIMITEMSSQLMTAMINNDHDILSKVEEKHDNITKLVAYCLRIVSKYEYKEAQKSKAVFHFVAQLDKIIDILKYVARDQRKYNTKISRDSKLIIGQIHNSLLLLQLLYHNIDSEIISSLDKNRNDVKDAIWYNSYKIPELEIKMISLLSQVQELILDLTEYRFALEI